MSLPNNPVKHRFQVLDVFRGIFASLVVFYHMSAFSDTAVMNNEFIRNSDLFVDFFFVLSGFVICYSYQSIEDKSNVAGFLYKRFIRLYPLHLLMLIIFLLIEIVKYFLVGKVQMNNSLDNSPVTFITSFFLINSISFPGVRDVSWNMVSWSISAEMISYIVFAFSCFLFSRSGLNKLKPFAYFIIVCIGLTLIFINTGHLKLAYTYDYGFLRGIIGFFIGTLCFYFFNFSYSKLVNQSKVFFTFFEMLIVILVIYMVFNGKVLHSFGILFELAFFIAVYVFAFQKGYLSSGLKKIKLLNNMGKYSYSIYMIHTLFISVFNVLFIRVLKLPPTSYWYLFIINYIVIYWVASWTYQNVEMRFQNKLKARPKSL